jgi:hypothetical protein
MITPRQFLVFSDCSHCLHPSRLSAHKSHFGVIDEKSVRATLFHHRVNTDRVDSLGYTPAALLIIDYPRALILGRTIHRSVAS